MKQEKRYTRAYQVTVGTKSTVVHTETKSEAIERAITKLFGTRCFWFADSGLPGYGQVFEALQPTKNNSNPGNSSVTNRVGLDVEPIGKPSRNFLKQKAADAEIARAIQLEWENEQREYGAGMDAAHKSQPRDCSQSYEWQRGYDAGIDDIERTEQYNRDEKQREIDCQLRYDNEIKQQRENEFNQDYDEAIAENAAYDARASRRRAEVERLRSLPIETRCSDERLQTIIRNTIAPSSFPTGLPLGDYKRRMLSGEYPEIVTEYLQSEKLFYRVNYID